MSETKIKDFLINLFLEGGLNSSMAILLSDLILLMVVILISILIFWITKKIVFNSLRSLSKRTKATFDDFLLRNKLPTIIAYYPSLFFLSAFLPELLTELNTLSSLVRELLDVSLIALVLFLVRSLLLTLKDYLKTLKNFKDKPIDSYIQVIMIFLWFFGGLLILSILTGKNISTFLTTFGALSAIILLIFRDSILGLVASIQITVNDTVRIGDWITMKSNDVDGDVTEISLTTVKVRNFDNTITSIPTYKLMSDPFVNWRGMLESGGRRIKRSLLIRAHSVRFLNSEELNTLQKIALIAPFIEERKKEIDAYNTQKNVDKSILVNGRNMTNLGLFRNYTTAYLKNATEINHEMTLMCRQLAPTSQGIPLEVYAFTKDKVWVNYEGIMSDIFDHLIAAIPYFHLECFELTNLSLPKT